MPGFYASALDGIAILKLQIQAGKAVNICRHFQAFGHIAGPVRRLELGIEHEGKLLICMFLQCVLMDSDCLNKWIGVSQKVKYLLREGLGFSNIARGLCSAGRHSYGT
jgi:hypothetical protein